MKKQLAISFELLAKNLRTISLAIICSLSIAGCTDSVSAGAAQAENDRIKKEFDSINASLELLQKPDQKKIDSINHVYLDSLTKHMDTNNAEFGEHH